MGSRETIAAISTAFGNAGIAIVRISGPESLAILKKAFESFKKPSFEPNKMYLGKILAKNSQIIDEVLAVYFKAPASFTGQDMVEINCHGGFLNAQKVLKRILELGASLAGPGEFTERAFLEGKIDLTQAEAIADIIYAKSDKAQALAQNQLAGHLSFEIKKILQRVLDIYGHLTTDLDYPDEELPELSQEEIIKKINGAIVEINKLLSGVQVATLYKEGLKVAIVGLPNAGKSSLLNALVKDARAIVTDIPGTTRDVLESQIEIKGVLIRLFDTAGITDTDDKVEKEGVKRSFKAIQNSDLLILVIEQYKDIEKFLKHLKPKIKKIVLAKKIILIKNKIDIKKEKQPIKLSVIPIKTFEISAKKPKSLKEVEEGLVSELLQEETGSILLNSLRQKQLLIKAKEVLVKIIKLIKLNEKEDIILIELETAKQYLEEIIGQKFSEAMLEKVFSRFCVGK